MGRGKIEIKRIENTTNRQVFHFWIIGNGKKVAVRVFQFIKFTGTVSCFPFLALELLHNPFVCPLHSNKNPSFMGLVASIFSFQTYFPLAESNLQPSLFQYSSTALCIKSTIERYKKACSDSSNTSSITEINAQYYQQESAKLRQQIQMLQNSNRHLMGDSLSSLTVKELKQLENRLERGITRIRSKKHELLLAEIEYLQKREIELENESVCLRTKIAEIERLQQANMVTGAELNAIQALTSRNFFGSHMIEGGAAYSHPSDKKILHLGYSLFHFFSYACIRSKTISE
ncbi:mads box protein, putative [Ricinus communis]|uniref:Mads box protein, putative n=1 Tax=Ricinus communis TaxID=3988 RepID=B9R8X9_RICCO|nr:mads box protein, putative [Ricinus communis]